MTQYVDEFLYRGRAPEDGKLADWHAKLGSVGLDDFGRPYRTITDPLTPEQAQKLGFGLPEILAAIDAAALHKADALEAELGAARADNAVLAQQLVAAAAEHEAAMNEIKALFGDMRGRIEALEAANAAPLQRAEAAEAGAADTQPAPS